jgi:hypothetical protein
LVWLGYWIGYAENTYQDIETEKAVSQLYELAYRTLAQAPSKEIAITKLKRLRTWCGIHDPANKAAHTLFLEGHKFVTAILKFIQEMDDWGTE